MLVTFASSAIRHIRSSSANKQNAARERRDYVKDVQSRSGAERERACVNVHYSEHASLVSHSFLLPHQLFIIVIIILRAASAASSGGCAAAGIGGGPQPRPPPTTRTTRRSRCCCCAPAGGRERRQRCPRRTRAPWNSRRSPSRCKARLNACTLNELSHSITLRKLPLMTTTKIADFLLPPPCPHLELINSIKFKQPPLLCPLFHYPPPPSIADIISGGPCCGILAAVSLLRLLHRKFVESKMGIEGGTDTDGQNIGIDRRSMMKEERESHGTSRAAVCRNLNWSSLFGRRLLSPSFTHFNLLSLLTHVP